MKQWYYPVHSLQAKAWANGTTTELVKFPPESDFLKRDFIFRISTATVEAEESSFSDFSGLTRILMVLEGSLELIHEGRYQKHLQPYEQDTFDGSWSTRSKGKVRDFNVMFNDQAAATLRAFTLQTEESLHFTCTHQRIVLFVHTGTFQLGEQVLETGSVLDIDSCTWESIPLACLDAGTILISEVEVL